MYLPRLNQETDRETLYAFMKCHSFATFVTSDANNVPFATHLPVLLDTTRGQQGTLVAHMARANPQWKQFLAGEPSPVQEVLVIFQGPHAYVSPSWYESEFSVPTWNYAVVHAYGIPQIVESGDTLKEMLTELVATFEEPMAEPWSANWSDVRNEPLLKAIVGFELEITRLEGKFKLSQNRPAADQIGVIEALEGSENQTERETAALMRGQMMSNGVGK